jgi:hypothetical protein
MLFNELIREKLECELVFNKKIRLKRHINGIYEFTVFKM